MVECEHGGILVGGKASFQQKCLLLFVNFVLTSISPTFLSSRYAMRVGCLKMSETSWSSVNRWKLLYKICLICFLSGWKKICMPSLLFGDCWDSKLLLVSLTICS